MPGFRHILCPVDFSDRSKAIRPYIKAYVEKFNAKLTLLNAIEVPPPMGGLDPSFPVVFDAGTVEPRIKELLRDYLDLPGATHLTSSGDAAVSIADYARNNGVDLIMMA